MTNISRHQAGATVAGEKTGGQFKAGERTSPDGGALGSAEEASGVRERVLRSAARLKDLARRERELRRERDAEALRCAGLTILAAHPDAAEVVLGATDNPDDTWRLAGILDPDRGFIYVPDELAWEVNGHFVSEGYRPAADEALDDGDLHLVGDWPYAATFSIQEITQDPEPKPAIDLDSYERDEDGRLTVRARQEAFDDIEAAKYRSALRLNWFSRADKEGLLTPEDHDAWNATHDLRTELDSLDAEVTINRGYVEIGSSEWLAMNNID